MFGASFAAFIVSCALYGAIAFSTYSEVKSLHDYFHTRRKRNGIVVLVLGNLTLGTGLLYLSELAVKNTVLALLAPCAVLAGYWLLAAYAGILKRCYSAKRNCRSYLDFLLTTSDQEMNQANRRVVMAYVCMQALVYLLLCAFELYASSTLYIALTGPQFGQSWTTPFGVSAVLLALAVAYTWAGGMRAAVGTDLFQAIFVVLSLLVLLALLLVFPSDIGLQQKNIGEIPGRSPLSLWQLGIAGFSVVVNAILTQFYSTLNISIATNYATEGKIFVFTRTAVLVAATLLVFGVIGIAASPYYDSSMTASISGILNKLSNAGDKFTFFAILVVAGFVALQLSTLDGTMVVVQQSLWDMIRPNRTFAEGADPRSMLHARLGTLIIGVVILIFTFVMFESEEIKLVPLLLTVIWPLTLCAPVFAISAYHAAVYDCSIISRGWVQFASLSVVIASWGVLLVSTWNGMDLTAAGSLFVCVVAFLYFAAEQQNCRIRKKTALL